MSLSFCHAPSHSLPSHGKELLGFFLLLLGSLSSPAAAQQPSEHQVKAAFLYNFPNFVEWPEEALPDSATPLIIGILGEDPFGKAFAPFAGKTIKGRPVIIRRSTRLQELPLCHVLFICRSEAKNLPQILEYLQRRHVLTIGESEDFAQKGVMINFFLEENKVRFEINVKAAEQAGLKISSKLLRLARLVEEKRP